MLRIDPDGNCEMDECEHTYTCYHDGQVRIAQNEYDGMNLTLWALAPERQAFLDENNAARVLLAMLTNEHQTDEEVMATPQVFGSVFVEGKQEDLDRVSLGISKSFAQQRLEAALNLFLLEHISLPEQPLSPSDVFDICFKFLDNAMRHAKMKSLARMLGIPVEAIDSLTEFAEGTAVGIDLSKMEDDKARADEQDEIIQTSDAL